MKIIVGLSGGVDSAVCAYLLKKEGHEVIGATMRTYDTPHSEREREDAVAVAERLGIPHMVMDYREEFKREVIDYFVNEYTHARTPNPCCVCNRRVKFDMLLRAMEETGADGVATGHYASVEQVPDLNDPSKLRYALRNADSEAKDQTYALYNLTQEQLKHVMLPLGRYTKPEVRELAREAGLFVADKHDSLDICFIPDGDYQRFIQGWELGFDHKLQLASGMTSDQGLRDWNKKGYFVDQTGKPIGWHKGIINYTIGQRRGLDLPMGERVYVTKLVPERNEVVIGSNEDLFSDQLECSEVNWQGMSEIRKGDVIACKCKIRYKDKGTDCTLERTERGVLVRFAEKVRAITPGQAAVFYRDGLILGGGLIL